MDDIETVNPYDPPERQALEQQLENDTHIEHQIHSTIQQEQHLADTIQQAGTTEHPNTDARIQSLERGEQKYAGKIVEDQQAIDHWDHAHPGWDQAGATAAGDSTGDGSGDTTYADDGAGDGGGYADSTPADDTTYDDSAQEG